MAVTSLDADRYDRWFDAPWGAFASTIERNALAEAVGPDTGPLLDAGCGTGQLTARRPAGFVVGADRDPAMLALARGRLQGPVVLADAARLPFADDTFATTVAVTLCEFTRSAAHTIAELVRVTRGGGRVVIGALNRNSPWGLAHRREFDTPPWSGARFLTETVLRRIGTEHGSVTTTVALYAPGAGPGLRWWGPALERVGQVVAPHHGAFIVATIDLPGDTP
jgi:SAM-dependent methyltransferase